MMKRIGLLASACVLALVAAGALTGCGAALDREVTVRGMAIDVPNDWLEQPAEGNTDARGSVSFSDEDDDLDDDETGNSITISYRALADTAVPTDHADPAKADGTANGSGASASATAPSLAARALAAKQAQLQEAHGVTAWSIDKEETRVVDGAQVTVYEYSFVKDIGDVRHKYEYSIAYVTTPGMMYEVSVIGNKVRINTLVDTIEF